MAFLSRFIKEPDIHDCVERDRWGRGLVVYWCGCLVSVQNTLIVTRAGEIF